MVKDEYQNHGIGTEHLEHLSSIARKQGLLAYQLKHSKITGL